MHHEMARVVIVGFLTSCLILVEFPGIIVCQSEPEPSILLIALFQDGSNEALSPSELKYIEDEVNSRSNRDDGEEEEEDTDTESPQFNVSFTTVDVRSHYDIVLANQVRQLHCRRMVSLLTTDTRCFSPWVEAIRLFGTPTFRLSSELPCGFPQNHILQYPPRQTLEDVLRHLLDGLSWKSINIFYDESLEFYVKRLVSTLEDKQSVQLKLLKMAPSAGTRYVQQAVQSSLDHTADKTNNIVICETDNMLTIVEQADYFEKQVTEQRQSLHHSRWLFFVESQDDVAAIGGSLRQLDNVAILHLKKQPPEPLQSRVQSLVQSISSGINNLYVGQTSGNESLFLDEYNTSCPHTDTVLAWETIQDVLSNTSDYQSCQGYELYTVSWQGDQKVLRHEALCANDGKSLQKVEIFPNEKYGFSGRHFRVVTIESSPFVMSKMVNQTKVFYGMCIDMLDELASTLNFTYSLIRSPDGQFGGLMDDGYNWTGMVGQLQHKHVDLAVASLSVTEIRDTVIDFVEYFYEYGGVLMRKPDEQENKWRVIVQPFNWQVWICILVSIPLAGLIIWIISRLVVVLFISDWDHFSRPNKSVWYVFGAILTQGGDIKPNSSSGRAFICSWWGFCIIIVAAYCGSLIAFLTISKDDAPFRNLEAMVSQGRYTWGTKKGSIYETQFKLARGGIYQKIWQGIKSFNETDPSVLSKATDDHFEKVRQEDFAFITDRTPLVVQAVADESCRLVVMDEMFMPMPFGIGLQEGSPNLGIFKEGVTKLRQIGLINFWQQKWWPRQTCSGIPVPESHAITLLDTQSAFYLLLAGVVLATLMLTMEVVREQTALGVLPRKLTLCHRQGVAQATVGTELGVSENIVTIATVNSHTPHRDMNNSGVVHRNGTVVPDY